MRYYLWTLAALVLAYSVGLLWYIAVDAQPGIHCLLRGANERGPLIAVDSGISYRGDRPRNGDRIVAIAGRESPTFIHFHRRFNEAALATAEGSPPVNAIEPAHGANLPAVTREEGKTWVRIDLEREGAGSQTAWVALNTPTARDLLLSWAWFALELLIFGIGAMVVWRRPGDASAALFFVLCAVQVVMFLGAFHWPRLVDTRWLLYPFLFCAVVSAPLMLHFHLLFPRLPLFVRRWPRSAVGAVYAIPGIWLVLMFASLIRMAWLYEGGAQPEALTLQLRLFTVLMYAYLALALAMFVASQALLVRHFLRARKRAERNQVKWLLAAMFVGAWPVGYLLYTSTWRPDEFVFGVGSRVMLYATSAVFAVGYALSITRYKLQQAGRMVDRGLVYLAISFAATAVFCGLVGVGTMLVGRYYFSWQNAAAAGLTAMLVVILLGALRDRFQRALDRRFHKQKHQLDQAMLRLSEAVDQLVEPAQLARQLLQSARDAVRADRGAVYLRNTGAAGYELAAWTGWPTPPERELDGDAARRVLGGPEAGSVSALRATRLTAALTLPLELEGEAVGMMILGPKEDATAYTLEDRAFLAGLVQAAALALRSARGHRTIEALRQELHTKVEKIAEQQQRIHFLQSELLNLPPRTRSPAPTPQAEGPLAPRSHERRIVGSSPALTNLLRETARVASSNSSVMIRGESGTGKELLAQAIHEQSPRAAGPFVAVHCAALSAGLLESELFGHVRGSFTGADRDKAGRFELADQGTLFLDEIGDISPETQVKLLRVLQERSIERVGGTRTIPVDVRLVTATHQDLEALIRQGRFREDLYYRLNVISLRCPALRDRREDIFELAVQFLRRYSAECGKAITRIEEDAVEALCAYAWPGNIRQLENALQRAVVLAEGDAVRRCDLPPEVLAAGVSTIVTISAGGASTRRTRRLSSEKQPVPSAAITALGQELHSMERNRLVEAIARADGNKAAAARLLGLPRSTFFSKLRKFGLE